MMIRKKALNKVGYWIIIIVVFLIIAYAVYYNVPYKVEFEYIAHVESERQIKENTWQCYSIETVMKELSEGNVFGVIQNQRVQDAIDKLKELDGNEYKILMVYGSEIENITKDKYYLDQNLNIEYRDDMPKNNIYLYTIKRNIRAVNSP